MQNAQLDESQGGIKIAGGNTNNQRYADDTTPMAESEGELKRLLMRMKEDSEKTGLKQHLKNQAHGIQSHHFMAHRRANVKAVADSFFSALESLWTVTAAVNTKTLAPWKQSYAKPRQRIKKQRRHFAHKNPDIQSYGFPSNPVEM